MKKAVLSGMAVLAALSLATAARSEEASRPTIAVLDFINWAGAQYDFLKKQGGDKLEILLAKTGLFTVLDRERLLEVIGKPEFGRFGELDAEMASRIAEKAGAQFVAQGVIRAMGMESRRYEGPYGEPTVNLQFSADAALKIVDAKSGKTWYADEETTRQLLREARDITIEKDDISDNLLEEACEKMVFRLQERWAGLAKPAAVTLKKVPVSVSSQPPGADIVVDGITVGTTPAELDIAAGVHLLELRLEGFAPYRVRIAPTEEMKINPQLMKLLLPPPAPESSLELKSRTVTDELQPQGGAQ